MKGHNIDGVVVLSQMVRLRRWRVDICMQGLCPVLVKLYKRQIVALVE